MNLGIGNKLRLGFGLVVAITIVCAVTGLYGIRSLGGSLEYLLGPAWDTADGAMEGSIEVASQMLAAQEIRRGEGTQTEARERLAEASENAALALGRLSAAGLVAADQIADLERMASDYSQQLERLLADHAQMSATRAEYRVHVEQLVKLGEVIEEIGDGAVEAIEAHPDRAMRWNGDLRWRWEAADGGMESNIGLLLQLNQVARMEGGAEASVVREALAAAESFQVEAVEGMLATGAFEKSAQEFARPEVSLGALYSELLERFHRDRDLYVDQFYELEETNRRYQEAADVYQGGLAELEQVADGAVEGEADKMRASNDRVTNVMTAALVLGIALGLSAGFLLSRSVTHSLRSVSERLREVADGDGDLTKRIPVTSDDEIGELAASFNLFADKVHGAVREVVTVTQEMTSGSHSATHLAEIAGGMVNDIRSFSEQAGEASTSTVAISDNISTVAAAVEESSTNVHSVASAVEQVSANLNTMTSNAASLVKSVEHAVVSVGEVRSSLANVAENSAKAAEIAQRASASAKRSDEMVGALGSSALQIGAFVQVISDISKQTNLLALNATIEAASAGEAGRGFAVVANEVKDLAKQTAGATDEIREQVEAMRANNDTAVSSLAEIRGVVDEINGISQTIAELVREQLSSTDEIAGAVDSASDAAQVINRNLQEASNGSTEVARNAEELALGTNEIAASADSARASASEVAGRVQDVSRVASQMEKSATEIDQAADALSRLSEKLEGAVGGFTV